MIPAQHFLFIQKELKASISHKLFFLIFIGITSSVKGISQKLELGLQSGLGHYSMTDLKFLNNRVITTLPFEAKLIQDFPEFYYFQPEIRISYKRINIGIATPNYSSGSRISAKDYSGEYFFDSKINSSGLAFVGDLRLLPNPRYFWGIDFYSEFGYINSTLYLKEYLKVYSEVVTNDIHIFKSKNYFYEYGVKFCLKYSFLALKFNYGYLIQFGDNILEDNKKNELRVFGRNIKPNWDGTRMGVSLFLTIPLNKIFVPDK